MNKILVALSIVIMSVASSAQLLETKGVRYNNIQACSFWNFVSNNGVYGYVCSSSPMNMMVPDAYDTSLTIDRMTSKINELEKRIADLEAKLGAQPPHNP